MTNKRETNKTINRRELLKALAATGGAVTATTMLPGKWTKPVIEAGVLPAHAQTSQFTLTARRVFNNRVIGNGNGDSTSPLVEVEVQMDPPLENVGISDSLNIDGDDLGDGSTQPTDSEGKAFFEYFLCDLGDKEVIGQGIGNIPFIFTYRFADQGTYGPDTDAVSGEFDPSFCLD